MVWRPGSTTRGSALTWTASVTPLTFKPIFRGTLLPAATSMVSLLYGLKPDRLAATE